MPVNVHPAIRFSRYAALLLGIAYGYRRNESLKPIAAHDREVDALRAKEKAELKAARDAAAAKVAILYCFPLIQKLRMVTFDDDNDDPGARTLYEAWIELSTE